MNASLFQRSDSVEIADSVFVASNYRDRWERRICMADHGLSANLAPGCWESY